ncbi:MAG TPA: NAD(P)-dependent oxidoreductase [Pyrinomonadaceae bacterium]|nr:NAD(P)-dependent oxidoreductase [Pyrinomonadaceae bacterium]
MKVLVTGGSGYLGTFVRQYFTADDFSRRSGFDVRDEQAVERVKEYDAVIHLAAHFDKSPDGAAECFRTNATGTANVIRNMKPGAAFIYASTKDVYGSHAEGLDEVAEDTSTDYTGQSGFEWSKFIGERYVEYYARQHNVRACIFRLSTVYARATPDNDPGIVTHYVESIKHRSPIRLPAGVDPVRDFLYVDDFSQACRFFIGSGIKFGLYNLGGGPTNALSLREMLKRVGAMIDIEPVIEEVAMPAPVPLRYVSNITHASKDLGWRPWTNIDDGLSTIL